ncbi:MAG: hypothetical protein A2Y03_05665 [Omnitrophica WOR_2 bacterium GWF2_38_59]|nr:MAG: hypothetical protein A2Y03_05665 [Omnitrophica WOR_2 bacterium GWF2_38_59]OGX51261.1 MAG: hypothetical protein A2243_05450 [Omnitrophica WOR_2 bacterium RIFOXYA2_FULL_38_17]OGX53871.1 MAG: hypothetical protein A2267_08920 [Omnitrophica WOR_2 bacterium RIFOXYA12_FULL_38_10]OGX55382.1 MAG: hypothetical protein A2306_06800 [Omnitrophica WOR_2 bacterium RIFOXYB2_FULL_38_16]OGX57970.1 MAG: hypothetical protein A2447_02225 [Omnitrophica WOR_2 bacterium RIFOXYC2_FULL_38_12]HBG62608.1 hypothet
MKIALVFNPFKYKVHEENIRIVQKYFGLYPPLSLAWVAAIAEKEGHEVIIVDARTLNLSMEEALQILEDFKPDIMGFMITTYMFPETLGWIKFLKSKLNIPVVVGGYNLRVYPKETLSHKEIDFGIVEQAYYTLPRLLEELSSGNNDFDNVPGLIFKRNGETIITPHPQIIDFDKFPNPSRHLLPNELYAEFPTERKNFTVMVTSLGCPFKCSFCEAGGTVFNPRSAETVVAEIEECYHKHGIREIDIFDYSFTIDPKRVSAICKLLQEKKLDLIWACRSRVDSIDHELLIEMKKAGCSRIYFGIESGDQIILNTIKKNVYIKQIKDIINFCNKIGIKTLGFFLIGAPGDTKESILKTIKFSKSLNLDYAQFSKCLAKPLTPLWKEMIKEEQEDYWKEWILGNEEDREISRPWSSLTNEEIDKLTKKAYISFYFRPHFILKHLINIRSFSELKRKFLSLFDMIFSQESVSKEDLFFTAFNENTTNSLKKHRKILK